MSDVNIWREGSPSSTVNANSTLKTQAFTATQDQQTFSITNFVYAPGTGSIIFVYNGSVQTLTTDYYEVDPATIKTTFKCNVGDSILIIGFVGISGAVNTPAISQFFVTATAGQTVFPTSYAYTPGANMSAVYVNGSRLYVGRDYAETSGTVITLNVARDVGDEVLIVTGTEINSSWTSADQINFLQAGTGAQQRTVTSKLRDVVSVKDFGAIGDGLANDTAAINAALSAVYSTSKAVYFPAGIYVYDGGGQLGNGVVVFGDGRNATIIRSHTASPTSGCLFYAYGYGSGIESMAFYAGVTQTAGSYVVLGGPESYIEDFYMTGDFNGILMTGNVSRIRHGRFQDGAVGAIRIRAEGGDNSQLIDDVLMGAQSPQISSAGIRVRNSFALIISNTSVIQQGHNLLIDPYTATQGASTDAGSVGSLFVNNCFFDNASGNAVRVAATGTGSVVRSRFANCWLNSAVTDNVLISSVGSGIVEGLSFESCHSVLSPASGYTVGAGVTDLSIMGGLIANNGYGIYLSNALTKLRIMGVNIGAGGGLSGNTNAAITLSAVNISDVLITNNIILGNGSGIVRGSTGTDIEINNNLGVDEYVSFTPTLTFGGASVGMAYSAQIGSYIVKGSQVEVDFKIILTAKGTSTGAAAIGGLPYTVSQAAGYMGGGFPTNLTNLSGIAGAVSFQCVDATKTATVVYQSAGGFGALTDANFTNTAVIYGKIFYKR